jgi:hypothetical protein
MSLRLLSQDMPDGLATLILIKRFIVLDYSIPIFFSFDSNGAAWPGCQVLPAWKDRGVSYRITSG